MKQINPVFDGRRIIASLVLACVMMVSCKPGTAEKTMTTGGPEIVGFKVLSFPLDDVRLKDGPYQHATRLDEQTLLTYQPDRFLSKFRKEAGLQPKAESYEGWEGESLAGHSLGHYLTALTFMYQTTGNEEFRKRANYIVDELAECQQAVGTGYVGAFENGEKVLSEQVAKGIIKAQGFNLNGLWSPFYTIHKIMDGLYHVYKYVGNQRALDVEQKLGDWVGTIVQNLTDEQRQQMLNCEFGGMNEAFADLYGATGDEKYLTLSYKFKHDAIIDPIVGGVDILAGKHCNTQVPKFVGLARRYELTGDSADFRGAVNFWNMMVHHHAYVAGNFDNYEYLGEPDQLNDQLSNSTAETCCVYNMLKLSRHLFEWTASAEVMDYYERALINHILSSQHPETGHVIYNLSLDMGGFKEYQDPYGFTCCVGSGMENHSKYGRNIYYHSDNALYVGQFIGSELSWKEKGVSLIQTTQYPEEEGTSFEIQTESGKAAAFDLKLRYPAWARNGISVKVNGKDRPVEGQPGSFISLGNKWEDGDKIEVHIPFSLYTETMPDNKNRIAVFNGPVLLAGYLGPLDDPKANDPLYVPVLMTKDTIPSNWLRKIEGQSNTFELTGVSYPRQVTLKPFYRTQDCLYTVYWDSYSAEDWKRYQQKYEAEQARKNELERKTIDIFRMGEMQPERDHNFTEDKSWVGEYKSKKYREVDRGGKASFEMKIDGNKTVTLVFEYWGGFAGSHTFDIVVEGQKIATENITNKAPGKFIDETYKLPLGLTNGKKRIKVELLPHDGHRAGPVFTVRTIHDETES
ncbi:glycoside hydrolase family 127 protein [Mangrovibacterium marinum]|nr:glycoside hydrolase family 127 protein [Mangrovibacterium marinum]